MRTEKLYLNDIIEAADAIASYIARVHSYDDFLRDDMCSSAVIQKFTVIGEAAGKLPVTFRETHSTIPWHKATGMRNILVHTYFGINHLAIWNTAINDIPLLRNQVLYLLQTLS